MPVHKLISLSGKNRYYKAVEITETKEGTLKFEFPYDEYLKDEVKCMDGARWNPDLTAWTVKNNRRNWFQIHFLEGKNPYAWYDRTLVEFTPRIKTLYPQQYRMAQEAITYRQVIWAAEMGLGKTLAAIMAIEWAAENLGYKRWWWVGPKSALASFDVEVATWGMLCYPERVMTYDELVKVISKWPKGLEAPHGVVFDEFSRCKTPTTKRTQASTGLAEGMRQDHGENDPFIIGMTGTPAPKSPLDWYSQCDIAKPGFIREGNIHKFRDRLGVVVQKENTTTGGVYPQVLGWKDSEERCGICGSMKDAHDFEVMGKGMDPHNWVKGTNEVARLYKRMKGLVSVYFKKEWLSHLPDKQYRILRCKVSRSAENAARSVQASARTAIQALTMLRELSDGFLYQEETQGTMTCPLCVGSKRVEVPVVEETDGEYNPAIEQPLKMIEVDCTTCGGSGEVEKRVRVTETVASPKDDLLEEILDDHEDGRLVVYAGFTGSLDRVVDTVTRKNWNYIRVDGRGWSTNLPAHSTNPSDMLFTFQKDKEAAPKLVFIGHPGSAGMGLTLTASNEIVYFSNDFNAESRIQSEDRIHRPGMDVNKGAMITDLVHLSSDLLVLKNLQAKRRLQDMSLGQFHESLKMVDEDRLS
jgi:hypothetical protein